MCGASWFSGSLHDLQARDCRFESLAGLNCAVVLCSSARYFTNKCTLSTQSRWVPGGTGKACVFE